MTIFDSIRYPIGDSVDMDQLTDIPDGIYEKWALWRIENNLHYSFEKARTSKESLATLRKIIAEYEE